MFSHAITPLSQMVFGHQTFYVIQKAFQFNNTLDLTCYEDTYKRISRASPIALGRTLPVWDPGSRFGRIWGSIIGKDGKWKSFPREFRGKGAPGALAMDGWSELIRGPEIWRGALKPGAVLQGWRKPEYFRAVRNGNKPEGLLGHSFVFVRYEYHGDNIVGMHVADNGFQNGNVVGPGEWPVLFGANTITEH